MSRSLHKLWLKVAAVVVGSFGPVFFLGTMPETMEPARLTLDLLSWPVDGATTYASPDTRFLSALTGGFLVAGSHACYAPPVLTANAMPRRQR